MKSKQYSYRATQISIIGIGICIILAIILN